MDGRRKTADDARGGQVTAATTDSVTTTASATTCPDTGQLGSSSCGPVFTTPVRPTTASSIASGSAATSGSTRGTALPQITPPGPQWFSSFPYSVGHPPHDRSGQAPLASTGFSMPHQIPPAFGTMPPWHYFPQSTLPMVSTLLMFVLARVSRLLILM